MSKNITLALFFFVTTNLGNCLADYSGLWWDPSKGGQGVSIFQNQSSICGAWYLYDSSGKDMWLVFTGILPPSNTFTTQLFQYTGPALGTPWDINQVKSNNKGTVTMVFNSDTSITMNYSVNGVSGTLNLEPFANDVASMYWDPDKAGQGIGLFIEGKNTYVVWYLYDKSGKDMWVTSGSDLNLLTRSGNLYEFSGPGLGSPWDSAMVQPNVVGNANVRLSNANDIQISYELFGITGTMNLIPFVCTASQCTSPESGGYEGTAPVTNGDKKECGDLAYVYFVLCDNSITGEAVDEFGDGFYVKGTVDSNNHVSGYIYIEDDPDETQPVGTFTGAVSEDKISGTWQDVWGCSGTYNLIKKTSISDVANSQ